MTNKHHDIVTIQKALNSLPPTTIIATDSNGLTHKITDAKFEENILYGFHPRNGLWFPVVSWRQQNPSP